MISVCACMGPRMGEPFCPCGMRSRGLKTRADDPETIRELNERREKLFGLIEERAIEREIRGES